MPTEYIQIAVAVFGGLALLLFLFLVALIIWALWRRAGRPSAIATIQSIAEPIKQADAISEEEQSVLDVYREHTAKLRLEEAKKRMVAAAGYETGE